MPGHGQAPVPPATADQLLAVTNPPLTGATDEPSQQGVLGVHAGRGPGVVGRSDGADGVYGQGAHNGVVGRSSAAQHSGVWADNTGGGVGVAGTSDAAGGVGVYGRGGQLAGRFQGNVEVTGDINVGGDVILQNADCAEEFDVEDETSTEPGTVMVLGREGALRVCAEAYDRRVVGVVSGAGSYKPAIILDRRVPPTMATRSPVALIGKVFCKVDASQAPIEAGDLLTTSGTPGHAMKATDRDAAFGAVLGKALVPLRCGRGLIPIVVALQ